MKKNVAFPIIAFVLATACNRNPQPGQGNEPAGHAGESLQLTLFTENTEFFMEYEALKAGVESGFLVHVTNLETYKPYPRAVLTMELEGSTVWTGGPEVPGIFNASVIPDHSGEPALMFRLKTGTLTDSLVIHLPVQTAGESREELEHDHPETAEIDLAEVEGQDLAEVEGRDQDGAAGDSQPEEIVFLKEQAWQSDFMVEQVRPEPFSWVIRTSGEFLAVPGKKRSLVAGSPGIITFTDRELVQGSQVMKDQLVFSILSGNLAENNMELRYHEYRNTLEKSRSQYLRHRVLRQKGVVSQQQLLDSRTGYTADSLRFYSLSEQISGEGVKVVAPITGYIHQLNISEGDYVDQGQVLVTISSNERLLLRADLPQHRFGLLDEIVTAHFRPAFTDKTYRLSDLDGSILSRGSSVAENNHYIPVFFQLRNDGTLLEGSFAEVYLKSRLNAEKVTVPLSAVMEELGNRYVYVQEGGESYYRRQITTGQSDGIRTEVLSGIEPGLRIVTSGTMLLKAASMVTAGGAEHGHAH